MTSHRRPIRRTTAAALHVGTTVRYAYRSESSLATVVDRSDGYVTFVGPDCDGRFTREQIDHLFGEGRLTVVLDGETHVPPGHPMA